MTRRISAANRKVAQGHVGKALQALLQPGVMEVTVETIEQLQQLHPDASKPISMDDVLEAATVAKRWLKRSDISARPDRFYDNGAAPGPSGWTGAMLRPLLNNDTCRRGLATIFSLIMNGEIRTPLVRDALRAARLIPVPKSSPGVRPLPSARCSLVLHLSLHCPTDPNWPKSSVMASNSDKVSSLVWNVLSLLSKLCWTNTLRTMTSLPSAPMSGTPSTLSTVIVSCLHQQTIPRPATSALCSNGAMVVRLCCWCMAKTAHLLKSSCHKRVYNKAIHSGQVMTSY